MQHFVNLKFYFIDDNFQMFFCLFDFCSKLRPEDLIQYTIIDKKDKRAPKAHVNAVFFRQLRELLRKYIHKQNIAIVMWPRQFVFIPSSSFKCLFNCL